MNDSAAPALALTEKRPHSRPGGCVGIFFQLFDWNRKLKKLFPRKLLSPARPKQAPKKFGGDNKLPKIRLIANENSGGFPNAKKNGTCNLDANQNPGMQPPGLVARLMGLESMPAAQQDEPKKASFFDADRNEGAKFVSDGSRFDKVDLFSEKGSTKHESRPQKLQKRGPSERQTLSRFGAEALQFKSVLSRARKHRPKLASPVKSPRMSSGRNASRLIDVAARILEPGVQAKNRGKCALTYSSNTPHGPKDEVTMERTKGESLDLSNNPNYHVTIANALKGQSCKNCGSVLDSPNLEENRLHFPSSFSNYVNPSFEGTERGRPRPAISALEQEKEGVLQRSKEQPVPLTAQARNNIRTRPEAIVDRKPLNRGGEVGWHLTSQQCKPQKDILSPIAFKHKIERQNQVLSRSRVSTSSNSCNFHSKRASSAANAINETKDFVALNRSPSSHTRSRMPNKVGNCKSDAEKKSCNSKQDDSLSPVRKRRSTNANQRGESSGCASSTFATQRNVRCDAKEGKGMRNDVQSRNRTCSRSLTAYLEETNRTGGGEDNDIVSFRFNPPMKQKLGYDITRNTIQANSILARSDRKTSSEKPFPLSGDALGAILEQTLKQLTCLEEDEIATGASSTKRATAMILQELISTLTAERPRSQGTNQEKVSCYSGQLLNRKLTFQAEEKKAGAALGFLRDVDHLSPGSVLEASFSNDRCLSSSLDDNSEPNHPDTMDCSFNEPQQLGPHAELLDSATSLNRERNGLQLVTDLLSQLSGVIYNFSFAAGLKGTKLAHAAEVIVNAELEFRNGALRNSNGIRDFSLSHFLIHELETLADVLGANFVHGNQLKEFLFDCVIEYLDSRFSLYCKSGFRACTRMSLCMNANTLITEVVEEVRRWTHLAGKIPDEIIEGEMSHSLGKWTDFDIEAYETGAEIDSELSELLVDEIVMELYEAKLASSGSNSSLTNS